MVARNALHSALDPHQAATLLVNELHSQDPSRFSRMAVRVCNGAVALTGSVPSDHAKAQAFQRARAVFGQAAIIDAIEVTHRGARSVFRCDVV